VPLAPAAVQVLARYNAWQNASLIAAAETLDEAARQADRGAFFGSIAGTFSHLLFGDLVWMSRFDGGGAPAGGIAASPGMFPDWAEWRRLRGATDARIAAWAGGLTTAALEGDLRWFSGALGRELTRPRALCVLHMFNHQTHHRGQIHAMLTAAGARPGDTDLVFMPGL
jgi:uncharacterized damage-inducible protein DinB